MAREKKVSELLKQPSLNDDELQEVLDTLRPMLKLLEECGDQYAMATRCVRFDLRCYQSFAQHRAWSKERYE